MTGLGAIDARPEGLWISSGMLNATIAMIRRGDYGDRHKPKKGNIWLPYQGGKLLVKLQNGTYHVVHDTGERKLWLGTYATKLHAEVEAYGLVEKLTACGCTVRECRKCKACI